MKQSCVSSAVYVIASFLSIMTTVHASVVRVNESDFQAGAGLITFSEYAVSTVNPTYNPGDYGGGAGAPVVTFDGFFNGQSLSLDATTDCPGAAATACVVGAPSGPLSLDASAPDTFITTDLDNPTSPVLSGTPIFNGPIAVLFSDDQAGVGFDAGYFNATVSTGITAFARNGSLIGTVTNTGTGIEFLGLVTSDGTAQIAGVFLDLVGQEPFGFAIDNLRFALQGQIIVPDVPLPAAVWLFGSGLLGLIGTARRKKVA